MTLPEGWTWAPPKDEHRLWRCVRKPDRDRDGTFTTVVAVESRSQDEAVAAARFFEAGRAAVDHRARQGWAFNHHSGFVD